MPQIKILECEETGSMKFYAVKVEIEAFGVADVTICEYCDVNSDSSTWEMTAVAGDSPEIVPEVWELEDEIIAAM